MSIIVRVPTEGSIVSQATVLSYHITLTFFWLQSWLFSPPSPSLSPFLSLLPLFPLSCFLPSPVFLTLFLSLLLFLYLSLALFLSFSLLLLSSFLPFLLLHSLQNSCTTLCSLCEVCTFISLAQYSALGK